jgi:Carboxypeptidase regulatory-like domain/TonB-dependent Receptor Plug Domain
MFVIRMKPMVLCAWRTVRAGAALAATSASLAAQAPVRAPVAGTVFDSVAMKPLAGALVRIVRADDPSTGRSATSDTAGRYAFDTVAAGAWLASFLHPALDSLRLEPGILQLEISDTSLVTMALSTPSGRTLFVAACGSGFKDDDGVISGSVRRADDDAPLAGATVEIEWPEWVLQKRSLVTDQKRLRATTDSSGRYKLCGAPAGSTLRAVTWQAADTSGMIEVVLPETGYAQQDFAVGAAEYLTPPTEVADTAMAVPRLRRGTSVVRGTVRTSVGTPLANASVRVLGSGASVRSSDTGAFTITDAVAGTQTVEARAIGFQPSRHAVRLSSTAPVELALTLSPRVVELDTVRVMAGREIPWDVQGIERRWRTGLGKFLDGRTVRERTSMYTSDALRGMAGVQIRQVTRGYGQRIMLRGFMGGECRASLFLDGMQVDGSGMADMTVDELIQPDLVAAIEVYPRANMVPAEYMTMRTGCGVVALWTKYGTGNVPILPPKSERP